LEKEKLDWLQGLRGLAAFLIVLAHSRIYLGGTPYGSIADSLLIPGAFGVDLFFMISGFIMVYTTIDSDGSTGYTIRFLIKRLARIWPVYAVISAIGLLTGVGLVWSADQTHVAALAKSLLFLPVNPVKPPYFDIAYSVGWTLNFEIYFYLIFGVSMLFAKHRWTAFAAWLALTLIILPFIFTGAISLDPRHYYNFGISYMDQISNPIIWDFAAGILIGKVYQSRIQFRPKLVTYNALFLSTVFALWLPYSGIATFHGITNFGAGAAISLMCVAIASKNISISAPSVMVWLGKISFSLYLCHILALEITTKFLIALGQESFTRTWAQVFLTVSLSISLASFSHRYLEQGLSEWVKRKALTAFDRYIN
jgi:exopolysaccharide production protein ExoZ